MTSWTRGKIEQVYRDGWRDFSGEDFAGLDLEKIDLSGAYLGGADLSETDLTGADLTGADLNGADLHGVHLTGANLTEANIDYTCWPLWCGSLDVRVDKRIAAQLMYHVLNVMLYSDIKIPNTRDELIDFANQMHRDDVKRLER